KPVEKPLVECSVAAADLVAHMVEEQVTRALQRRLVCDVWPEIEVRGIGRPAGRRHDRERRQRRVEHHGVERSATLMLQPELAETDVLVSDCYSDFAQVILEPSEVEEGWWLAGRRVQNRAAAEHY